MFRFSDCEPLTAAMPGYSAVCMRYSFLILWQTMYARLSDYTPNCVHYGQFLSESIHSLMVIWWKHEDQPHRLNLRLLFICSSYRCRKAHSYAGALQSCHGRATVISWTAHVNKVGFFQCRTPMGWRSECLHGTRIRLLVIDKWSGLFIMLISSQRIPGEHLHTDQMSVKG